MTCGCVIRISACCHQKGRRQVAGRQPFPPPTHPHPTAHVPSTHLWLVLTGLRDTSMSDCPSEEWPTEQQNGSLLAPQANPGPSRCRNQAQWKYAMLGSTDKWQRSKGASKARILGQHQASCKPRCSVWPPLAPQHPSLAEPSQLPVEPNIPAPLVT